MLITLNHRYLNFPVSSAAPKHKLTVALTGGPTRAFDLQLAAGEPEYYTFMDVSEFTGGAATVSAPEVTGLEGITCDPEIKGTADLYQERYRPQFHFSSRRGWLNDPNGLVYHAGEYHLFYQHNPYGWGWGNMHWGHAVSPDLVHWRELPIALYPDAHGTCFSGSAVVDHGNTAGLQVGDEKTMVALYTAAGDPVVQCLAYSHDRGRTWQSYAGNPVLGHLIAHNRDPKVIWHEPTGRWLMALYLDGNDFGLFASMDLKQWEKLSEVRVEGSTECPEFFPLALEGNPRDVRWVFYGGNGFYLVGDFDGRVFTPESGPHRLHHGNCLYASQTYNDEPRGRRVCVGWGTVEMPGMPFNQMMTFPVELTLHQTPEGPRLRANPVEEVASLAVREHRWEGVTVPSSDNLLGDLRGDLWDIAAELRIEGSGHIGLHVRGIPITYRDGQLSCQNCSAPVALVEGRLHLRVLADRTSLEIFAQEGAVYMPVGVIPADNLHGLDLFSRGATTRVESLVVRELRGIWGR